MFHCCDTNLTCKFHRLYGVQDFKSLVLKNYLADFNETYTCYRGGIYSLHTNLQVILNFHKNL